MYLKDSSTVHLSVADFSQFTHGEADMDLVDITYKADSHDALTQDYVDTSSSELTKNPILSVMFNPGSYVYRLDLTLDSEKLEGSEVEGIALEISPEPFDFFIVNNFEDVDNLTNKAMIVASQLANKSSVPKLNVVIDYRGDLSLAKNKALVDTAPDEVEVNAIFDSKEASKLKSNQIPINTSLATIPQVDISNQSFESNVNKTIMCGLDPFSGLVSEDSHISAAAKFSLGNNDIFDYDEDAVRIKSQTIMGETSLSQVRALGLAKVYESKGYTRASKDALKLAAFIKDQDSPLDKVQLGIAASITTKKFRVIRDIEVPKNIIGTKDKFYVRIRPVLKSQGTAQAKAEASPLDFTVSHVPQIQSLLTPVVPPSLSITDNQHGIIKVAVRSNDPSNNTVKVTRRVWDPRLRRFLQSKILNLISGEAVDQDVPNISPNKVYYTATIVDNNGSGGPSGSLVVDGINSPTIQAKEDDQASRIYCVNEEDGLQVTIENIPKDVRYLRIMREHVSGIGDIKSRTSAVSVNAFGDGNVGISQSRTADVLDREVADGHLYRYYAVLKGEKGLGYISEDDDIIRRRYPRDPLPYTIAVSEPKIMSKDPRLLVGFTLNASHKKESYEFFLNLMSNSGADDYFIDEIRKNRKYLSDILAFSIDRIDTTTGKKVSLGLRGPGEFIDGGTAIEGSAGLQSGRKYVYIIRVCVRPVQSFFANTFGGLINHNESSGTDVKTFMTKKFLDSASRFLGALPSDDELRQGSNPAEQLEAADTGLSFVRTLKTAKIRARITDFRQVEIPDARDKILRMRFNVSGGPLDEVLYAFVYCKTRIGTRIIDRVAICPSTNIYYFNDNKKYREVGTKTFFVRLLYSDLTMSSPSKQKVFKRINNLPRSLRRERRRTTR